MEEYNDKIYNLYFEDAPSEDLEENKIIANGIVVGDALLQSKMSFMDVHDSEKQN